MKTCEVWRMPPPGTKGRVGEQCGKPAVQLVQTKLQGKVWMCARHTKAVKAHKNPSTSPA